MSLAQRWQEIRTGFARPFWVANGTELFERLAYYGVSAVLAIYLHERLHFTEEQTGSLQGIFGFVVWFLPIFGGALADRLGYRRILSLAYLVLSVGYFMIGSITADWLAPVRAAIPLYWVVLVILMIPALGPGLVKPVVAGTTARGSSEAMRSLGYSIYYTIVNIGGALGPLVGSLVRRSVGVQNVAYVSALFAFAMFVVTILFFRELPLPAEHQVQTVGAAARNMLKVVTNLRVLVFLLLFSGFYVVFWQVYVALPLYIRGYVNAQSPIDALISIEGTGVILFTVIVAWLTRRLKPITTMASGVLITSLSWLLLTVSGSSLVHRGDAGRHRDRRAHAGAALLRVHLEARAEGAGGDLHRLRLPAHRHRLPRRRAARRMAGALLRDRGPPAVGDVVRRVRDRRGHFGFCCGCTTGSSSRRRRRRAGRQASCETVSCEWLRDLRGRKQRERGRRWRRRSGSSC